jgi:dolichol-phosphate mannosyltransferase
MKFSLVISLYNEEANVERLEREVTAVLEKIKLVDDYEGIFVNDGLSDQTLCKIKEIKNSKFKIFFHESNYGLTAGIYTGIQQAKYDIVGYIDADLQTNPKDFEKLLKEIKRGYDHASGIRIKQKAGSIRKVSSAIGHGAVKFFLGTKLQDTNCPLQVFKKECLINVTFYKNFHRFLSYLSEMQGYKVKEIPIKHYPRLAGQSYLRSHPWRRVIEGIRLLYIIKWMSKNIIRTKNYKIIHIK